MIVYLQGGPKAGAEVVVATGTSYWSFMEQIPGREVEVRLDQPIEAVDGVKRHRAGVYKDSGSKMSRVSGAPRPIFVWQGWQE